MTSIFVKTFGCSLNKADSERMAGLLSEAKFELVSSAGDADLIVINTCTVKQPTQNRFFNYLADVKRLSKPIVVAGCIPQSTPELVEGYSLIGTTNIHEIVPVVEETLNGNTVTLLARDDCAKLSLPKIRINPVVEIIPISEGCVGQCSYCIVKRARGELKSYTPESITGAARTALKAGVREVWITAQDAGCYGQDIGTNLPDLLKEIVKTGKDFMVRVGMLNPTHIREFLDELVSVYSSKQIFKFLHIPVQSGNDEILRGMNRDYRVADFVEIVRKFREKIPEITLATDIICGYPGESKEQFNDSVNLVKGVKPDVLNISRFWPRPGTAAASMEQVSGEETKERSRFLTSVFEYVAYENNRKWRGWEGRVVIDEHGKNGTWVGRNYAYKPVVLEGDYQLGEVVPVRVAGVAIHDLRGIEI